MYYLFIILGEYNIKFTLENEISTKPNVITDMIIDSTFPPKN